MNTRFVLAIVIAGGCSTPIDTTIKLDKATPNAGSLLGGTHIIIEGQGFRAAPNHVIIGGTEAPLASVLDDGTLEVVTPPGLMAGDAKITVFNPNGNTTAMGLFSYSTQPEISAVTPSDVAFDAGTTVTLTGSGFKDNAAGFNRVTVDGVEALDVVAASDTQLTFTAPLGKIFSHPTIKVNNERGEALKAAAYRVVPSTNPVLLMFTTGNTGTYAVTYDPMTQKTATVDNLNAPQTTQGYRVVMKDSAGKLWAITRSLQQGKLDIENQKVVDPTPIPVGKNFVTGTQIGTTDYVIDRSAGAYGSYDFATHNFSQIVASGFTVTYPNGMTILGDGTNAYLISGPSVRTLAPTTGALGTAVTITPATPAGERGKGHGAVLNNTLYFLHHTNGGDTELWKVDPTSGAASLETTFLGFRLQGTFAFLPGTSTSIQ